MPADTILKSVEQYYTAKITAHGPTVQGVDWNSAAGQHLRFQQLLKLARFTGPEISLLDYGCGFGSLADYLETEGLEFQYHGLDLSPTMIQHARQLHPQIPSVHFQVGSTLPRTFDYVISSGIFNVRQETSPADWENYIYNSIQTMAQLATRGFAYNILTSYSDSDKQRPDLHYADPCHHFDFCKKHYSRHVSLLHDYGLYEFTILVHFDPLT